MRFAASAASLARRSVRSFIAAPTKTTLFVAQAPATGMKIIRRAFSSGQPVVFSIESVDEFQEHVLNSPTPVLVDFYADWCGPCKTLGPRLEEKVASRGGAVLMAKINVDDAGEVAADHGITAVPTVVAYANGEIIGEFKGDVSDEELDDFVERACQAGQ